LWNDLAIRIFRNRSKSGLHLLPGCLPGSLLLDGIENLQAVIFAAVFL